MDPSTKIVERTGDVKPMLGVGRSGWIYGYRAPSLTLHDSKRKQVIVEEEWWWKSFGQWKVASRGLGLAKWNYCFIWGRAKSVCFTFVWSKSIYIILAARWGRWWGERNCFGAKKRGTPPLDMFEKNSNCIWLKSSTSDVIHHTVSRKEQRSGSANIEWWHEVKSLSYMEGNIQSFTLPHPSILSEDSCFCFSFDLIWVCSILRMDMRFTLRAMPVSGIKNEMECLWC